MVIGRAVVPVVARKGVETMETTADEINEALARYMWPENIAYMEREGIGIKWERFTDSLDARRWPTNWGCGISRCRWRNRASIGVASMRGGSPIRTARHVRTHSPPRSTRQSGGRNEHRDRE